MVWNTKTSVCFSCILAILRAVFCVVNNIYAISAYLFCYLLFHPLRMFSPELFWKLEGMFFERLIFMIASWGQLSGHTITVTGDDLSSFVQDESILIANHQATGDIAVLMSMLRGLQPSVRHVMWIMDWIFKFVNFGWISQCHGDFFLLQGSDIRRLTFLFKGGENEIKTKNMNDFKTHLTDVYCARDRKWIILFPEGGFLSKRIAGSQRFAKKNNLPVLSLVSLPRTGAFQAIVDVLGVHKQKVLCSGDAPDKSIISEKIQNKSLKWIIDVTIGYPEKTPMSIVEWVTGSSGPKKISIHCRVFPAFEMIKNEIGGKVQISDDWVYDRFVEKEKLLEEYRRTGSFPKGKIGRKLVNCHTFDTIVGYLVSLVIFIFITAIIQRIF